MILFIDKNFPFHLSGYHTVFIEVVDKDDDCEEDEAQTELLGKLLLHIDLGSKVEEEENDKDHMEEVNDTFHCRYDLWINIYHKIL